MELSDPAQQRLAEKTIEYAFRMEAVAKAYYEQHQANGCMCDICKNYELAYTSIAHGGPSGPGLKR